jgi:hypothetical protein
VITSVHTELLSSLGVRDRVVLTDGLPGAELGQSEGFLEIGQFFGVHQNRRRSSVVGDRDSFSPGGTTSHERVQLHSGLAQREVHHGHNSTPRIGYPMT